MSEVGRDIPFELKLEWREADPDDMPLATARALKRLPPNWMEDMLALYGQGCSDHEVMRELEIRPADFKELLQDTMHSNFAEIVEIGRSVSRAWWEGLGRAHVLSKKINVALYNLQMQNRFGWTTKSEESKTNIEIQSMEGSELDAKLHERLRKLGLKTS